MSPLQRALRHRQGSLKRHIALCLFSTTLRNTHASFPFLAVQDKASAAFDKATREVRSVTEDALAREVTNLKAARDLEKNRTVALLSRDGSPYHASFSRQVKALTVRYASSPPLQRTYANTYEQSQFQILWGDRQSNILQLV